MDADRFDALSRSLIAAGSRRHTLALALSGALASLLARDDAAAHDPLKTCTKKSGKQKKKCIKKAKQHNATHRIPPPAPLLPPPPLSCRQLCSDDCTFCYTRADGSHLCGNGSGSPCAVACASDTDCIGLDEPYCIRSRENRATGEIALTCGETPACAEVERDPTCRAN
jgi:hypothetical protein